MLTDGALRMLVLLHFNQLGFSPIQLAYLFLLYELAGIVTNLTAGWIAARFGLNTTLYAGLGLQVVALLALTLLSPDWLVATSVAFVMCVQACAGVAKDLTKMSAKSAVKILAPTTGGELFRWVALLTGSKNAVKGLGFFLGAAGLALLGFDVSLIVMAVGLVAVIIALALFMPAGLPSGKTSAKFTQIFARSRDVNWLSAARVFLFGGRDVWFVVGIPIYFTAVLSDGTAESARQAFYLIGGFMALWIILYGAMQASAPKFINASQSLDEMKYSARNWVGVLFVIPCALSLAAFFIPAGMVLTLILVIGLLVFGAVFALNSSLHSYLILAFSKKRDVTMDVGFYYMANAAGRLMGTLLSGLSYQIGGLVLTLFIAAVMIAASWLCANLLAQN